MGDIDDQAPAVAEAAAVGSPRLCLCGENIAPLINLDGGSIFCGGRGLFLDSRSRGESMKPSRDRLSSLYRRKPSAAWYEIGLRAKEK
jgi:hypothetical protein